MTSGRGSGASGGMSFTMLPSSASTITWVHSSVEVVEEEEELWEEEEEE